MKEFDYELPYGTLDFTDEETRKLYRIGRGEQGVLLVRPYTNDICAHWRFVNETALTNLLIKYTRCSVTTSPEKISLGWTWLGSSLRWDLLAPDGMLIILRGKNTTPRVISLPSQQVMPPVKSARSARIFKEKRDLAS